MRIKYTQNTLFTLTALCGALFLTEVTAENTRPFQIAHRGASGYVPEHTLAAESLAYGLGAEYIEQDVAMTSDDVPVVTHDITLDSTTDVAKLFPTRAREDGKFYVIDFTLKEVKSLHARERFNPKTGEPVFPNRFPNQIPQFRIPTFEEALGLITGLNHSTGRKVGVHVEIKRPGWHLAQGKDLGAAVVQMLAKYGFSGKDDHFFIQCFEFTEVKRLREKLNYQGPLVQLMGGKKGEDGTDFVHMRTPEGLRELAKWADGIGPSITSFISGESPESRKISSLVADAKAAGLYTHAWTARADELPKWATSYDDVIRALTEAGVAGYFTDFPGLGR